MGCDFFMICSSFRIFEISKLPAIKYLYCCVVFYIKVIRKSYWVLYDSDRCRNYYQLLNMCYEKKMDYDVSPFTIGSKFYEAEGSLVSSVLSFVPDSLRPMNCSTPGFPVHPWLPELAQTHVHQVGDAIQPSYPVLPFSSLIFPSIKAFSSESVLYMRWPKYWSFSFSISPFNEYSRLISFRMNWLDFLAVQGTLRSLLQHHSSKESINSLALSLLYGPTFTSVHDHWKKL